MSVCSVFVCSLSVTKQLQQIKNVTNKSCHICISDENSPWANYWILKNPTALGVPESPGSTGYLLVVHLILYRGSSDSADSISAVPGLVRIANRTILPKFPDLVRIANHSRPAET